MLGAANSYVERVIASFRESLVWLFQEDVQDIDQFSPEMDQQIALMVYDFLCNRIGLWHIEDHDPEQMGHDLCLKVFGTGIRFIDRDSYSPALTHRLLTGASNTQLPGTTALYIWSEP